MRTTLDLAADLLRRAKKRAADDGVPLRGVVEDALREYLSDRPRATNYKLKWVPVKGERMAGVDLDDRSSLFDLMDGRAR